MFTYVGIFFLFVWEKILFFLLFACPVEFRLRRVSEAKFNRVCPVEWIILFHWGESAVNFFLAPSVGCKLLALWNCGSTISLGSAASCLLVGGQSYGEIREVSRPKDAMPMDSKCPMQMIDPWHYLDRYQKRTCWLLSLWHNWNTWPDNFLYYIWRTTSGLSRPFHEIRIVNNKPISCGLLTSQRRQKHFPLAKESLFSAMRNTGIVEYWNVGLRATQKKEFDLFMVFSHYSNTPQFQSSTISLGRRSYAMQSWLYWQLSALLHSFGFPKQALSPFLTCLEWIYNVMHSLQIPPLKSSEGSSITQVRLHFTQM